MNKFMDVAKELAKENLKTNCGGPFGACVVKDNKIIGKGINKVLCDNDPTAHAEIVAIKDACKNINSYDLSGCEIYTTSYPCPMCLSAIIWSNIDKIYYGTTTNDVEELGFRDHRIYDYISQLMKNDDSNKMVETKCIDRESIIQIFKEFREKDDKTIY